MSELVLNVSEKEFIFNFDDGAYDVEMSLLSENDGVYEYKLVVNPLIQNPGVMTLKLAYHMEGFLSTWCPVAGRRRQLDAQPKRCENISNMYYGAPVYSVINHNDQNFSTVALSDAVNPCKIAFYINDFEEIENLYYVISFFEEWQIESEYCINIRVDERDIPFYKAIPEVSKWWKKFYPIEKEPSFNAELPLYSSWYNYHQNPRQESLLEEMKLASEYGFKSLIVDDGWSYPGRGPGNYTLCGDWHFCDEKFPDFKDFVKKVHDLGIKVSLWFPVPFVGYSTKQYDEFKDMLLYNGEAFQAGILDPRYPKVRQFLIDTYVDTVTTYDLDGLKLDFIDAFRCKNEEELCNLPDIGRDCQRIEDGVIKLMQDVKIRLSTLKPDFMIEQRQYYVGPAVVANCNMLRVLDCQFDFLTNRIGIADLRLMNYDLAVHADMLLWSHDETPQNIAKMLYNIMFGVPQNSVLLKNTNKKQGKVIKNYIDYWYKNRKTILHGEFKAYAPHMNYTRISSEDEEKTIEVLYSENTLVYDGKKQDVFNATEKDFIIIENLNDAHFKVRVYDCCGKEMQFRFTKDKLLKINVPVGGYMKIR